jgi:nucleotide-binding universal stress UspA family protein
LKNSILIALNDSLSSRAVIDYICGLSFRPEDVRFTLLHIYREPASGEELMGKQYMRKLPLKYLTVLSTAKDKLTHAGFLKENIEVSLVTDPYPTVADGIIDQFKKQPYTMVVVGRKRMSKAEEFVMGDASVKLVRALEGTAVMVVKLK